MTTYEVSRPVYPGTTAHGAAYKPVTVLAVDSPSLMALCRDQYGKAIPVRVDIMRAKGNIPGVGEQWLIDRQYGDWTFGAILNGGTNGVTADSVTGLSDALAEAAGSPALNDHAAEPGRWVGNTVSGPPGGGTYDFGDWVMDHEGYVWTYVEITDSTTGEGTGTGNWITRSGDPELITDLSNTLSQLQNRANSLETYGNHSFKQTSASFGFGDTVVRGMSTFTDGGIAELRAGVIYLNRVGRWSISGASKTVAQKGGSQTTYLYWPGGPMEYWPELTFNRAIGDWNGAGVLRQRVSWDGWVTASQARQPLYLKIGWYPDDGATGLDYAANDFYLECNYLGGA